MKIILSYFIIFCLFNTSVLSGNKVDVRLISNNNQAVILEVNVIGFNSTKKFEQGVNYDEITLDNTVSLNEPGEPSLPLISNMIEVPAYVDASITVSDAVIETYQGYNVYPYQEIPMRTDNIKSVFTKNVIAYTKNAFSPVNIASIKEFALLGNLRVAMLNIQPIQYNPYTKELKVYKKFRININFTGTSNICNPIPGLSGHSFSMEKVYRNLLINYEPQPDTFRFAPKMMIITADNLYNSILPFANWKNKKGLLTTVKKISELGFGQSPDTGQIRTYLTSLYSTGLMPEYLLLAGDVTGVNTIPAFKRLSSLTDHPYACLNGPDLLPDIAVGRLSVNDSIELTRAVLRLISYESDPNMQLTDWYKRAMVCFSSDGIDPVNGQVARSVFLNEGGFTNVDMVSASQGNLITGYKNGGLSWIWFIGHGSSTGWAVPAWSMSNIPLLTYGTRHPSIISVACANNDLDYSFSNCYGEEYTEKYSVNTPSNFLGFTENCAFYTTDTLAREMLYAYFRNSIYDFGSMMNWGKLKAYVQFNGNSTVQGTIYQAMDLGDPSQVAYSDIPKTLAVSLTASDLFTINVKASGLNVNKATVAINQNDQCKACGLTDANGNFECENSALIPGIPFNIVVTGKNLKPYDEIWFPVNVKNNQKPVAFSLSQNFPNPFNPVTNIKYQLPADNFVSLKVFDAIGREVAVLVNSYQKAGYYDITFNGNMLNSGVYFYKINYGNISKIQKMILVK